MTASRVIRAVLRVRLFYKILLANAAIVVLVALVWTLLGVSERHMMVPFALAGVVVSLAVNAFIVGYALKPLHDLEAAAERVQAGNLEARAPISPLADRELERLTISFNDVLEDVVNYRQRLRGVTGRAMMAEEAERQRVARELYDETSQRLAALLIRLRGESKYLEDQKLRGLCESVRDEVEHALTVIRSYAWGRRPPELQELGLAPAIQAYARTLMEVHDVEIRVEDEEGALPSPDAGLALYRIAQEALSNVVHHAEAHHAAVRVDQEDGDMVLTVEDDGRGFQFGDAMRLGGLGLLDMQERASVVGGTVDIDSTPGQGTRVRARVPIVTPGNGAL